MKDDNYLLSSLDNSLHILDILSHYSSLSLADLTQKTNYGKSSIFRMLYTLEKNRYVEKTEDGRYCLGIKFLYYENIVASRFDVITIAKPYMAGLCFHCKTSIHLGVLYEDRIITMHKEESPFDLHIRARGVACKAIFDCTVPFEQKDRFERAKFMDVDPKKWLPDMF